MLQLLLVLVYFKVNAKANCVPCRDVKVKITANTVVDIDAVTVVDIDAVTYTASEAITGVIADTVACIRMEAVTGAGAVTYTGERCGLCHGDREQQSDCFCHY